MKLIKRVFVDLRGPGQSEHEGDMIVNEELIKLQSNEKGGINKSIEVIDVKENTKDSGIQVFTIIYNDKGLDVTQE